MWPKGHVLRMFVLIVSTQWDKIWYIADPNCLKYRSLMEWANTTVVDDVGPRVHTTTVKNEYMHGSKKLTSFTLQWVPGGLFRKPSKLQQQMSLWGWLGTPTMNGGCFNIRVKTRLVIKSCPLGKQEADDARRSQISTAPESTPLTLSEISKIK